MSLRFGPNTSSDQMWLFRNLDKCPNIHPFTGQWLLWMPAGTGQNGQLHNLIDLTPLFITAVIRWTCHLVRVKKWDRCVSVVGGIFLSENQQALNISIPLTHFHVGCYNGVYCVFWGIPLKMNSRSKGPSMNWQPHAFFCGGHLLTALPDPI